MLKKKIAAVLVAGVVLLSISGQAFAAAFTDVPANHPYKAAIEFCQAKGYVTGVSNTNFKPDDNLTRAQLAVAWARFRLLRTNANFTDLSSLTKYYDTAALMMYGLGIMSGTTFSPESYVTREQLALIAMRTFNLGVADKDDYKKFTDYALISEWAQDAVSACINAKVLEDLPTHFVNI